MGASTNRTKEAGTKSEKLRNEGRGSYNQNRSAENCSPRNTETYRVNTNPELLRTE